MNFEYNNGKVIGEVDVSIICSFRIGEVANIKLNISCTPLIWLQQDAGFYAKLLSSV